MSADLPDRRPTDAEWRAALRCERALADELRAMDRMDVKKAERRDAARAWLATASWAVREYLLALREGRLTREVPAALLWSIAEMMEDASDGIVPRPFLDAQGKGKRARGSQEREHVAYASAYIREARAGRVQDADAIRTIMAAYGASMPTVYRWTAEPVPAWLDTILAEHSGDLAAFFQDKFAEAGPFQRGGGRGEKAIASRGRKPAAKV